MCERGTEKDIALIFFYSNISLFVNCTQLENCSERKKRGKLGQRIKSEREGSFTVLPHHHPSPRCVGVGPGGATDVNTVIKPLH